MAEPTPVEVPKIEEPKEIDRPFHVVCVLDGETYHSGHTNKEHAEMRIAQLNEQAVKLGIKARYIVKDNIPKVG